MHLRLAAFLLVLAEFRVSCFDLRFLQRNKTIQPVAIEIPTQFPATAPDTTDGVWSEWKEVLSCNAECGSCGSQVFRRTCIGGSSCRGNSRKEERCNIQVCDYPKPSCCPPFKLMLIEGQFACGPQQESVVAAFAAQLQAKPLQSINSPPAVLSSEVSSIFPYMDTWRILRRILI
ncbi:hypothetical protein COOONC_22693 [Cooperia oncophora]